MQICIKEGRIALDIIIKKLFHIAGSNIHDVGANVMIQICFIKLAIA